MHIQNLAHLNLTVLKNLAYLNGLKAIQFAVVFYDQEQSTSIRNLWSTPFFSKLQFETYDAQVMPSIFCLPSIFASKNAR
jgi:hypothetical protein